jgi:putative transposase
LNQSKKEINMAVEPLSFGCYYHIYNRGNNRENIFVERRNYPYFLKLYAKHIQPIAETYAYCLLPNHFHFAIRTYTEEEQEAYYHQNGSISKIEPFSKNDAKVDSISKTEPTLPLFKLQQPSRAFNNMFIAYARAFNKATNRTGVLFETPFGRKIVDNERYFMALITYIHRNPQKHSLIPDFRNWEWSSYSTILSSQPTKVKRDDVLAWYNDRTQFAKTHLAEVDKGFIAPLVEDDLLD